MEINIYKLFRRYGTKTSNNCPVERVAEDTAGGAEEAGARQYVVSPGLQKRGFSFTMETTNNPKGSITKMQRGDTTWKL